MRILAIAGCMLLLAVSAFSQAGTGTIKGTISDPAGAVVAGAGVEVRNTETGVAVSTVSTNTGAYSVPNLPPGSYEVSVTVPGFKKYTRSGLSLAVAQVLGIDIGLEVGSASESVTVSAEASLLKTESGDVAHNITLNQLQNLPILGIGGANAGSSGVRNPFNSTVLIPGVTYNSNFTMIVNGAPSNTAAYRLEGLDNTNHTVSYALQENQPSADAIQEVAVQTSNYAPEFGQAGGGLFNITMKSGTNQFHGTAYEYFVNDAMNAAFPYTNDGTGHKVRPRNRRNNYGGTFGGPIWIPKVYDGHDKTFFFFSYEEFRENSGLNFSNTVPTTAYRNGDFSAISPNGGANFNPNLGVPATPIATDALGRSIFANEIFDPLSRGVQNGNGYANPFPNNIIPPTRFSSVATAVQKLIPDPQNGNYVGNYSGYNLSQRVTSIPSLKLDHSLSNSMKLSGYWSTTGTDSAYSSPNGNADGFPELITQARGTWIHSQTERVNFDWSVKPTVLLHVGTGFSQIDFADDSPYTKNGGKFDCNSINITGCFITYNFPRFDTFVATGSASTLGGLQAVGNAQAHTHTRTPRPAFNANTTWIRGNHTYKFGGEAWFQGAVVNSPSGIRLTPGVNATAQPYSPAGGLSGQQMGFAYASFLLGDFNSIYQRAQVNTRMGKSQWAWFAQDSWKLSRKLTVDYGLRWDFATAAREQYGRSASLGLVTNPAAGGRVGAPIFEATCNCQFVQNYPWAYAPRIGVAYNLNEKTVIRGGWGFAYSFAPDIGANSSNNQQNSPSGVNGYLDVSSAGAVPRPVWPNFDPGQTPLPGQITGFSGFTYLDPHASRPPRQNQWSIGVQREINKDLVVEVSYVGNRGVWWTGQLGYLNQVSPATFAALGLNPFTNPADNLLLSSQVGSTAVKSRIGTYLPYAGYSTSNTLINALRPFPQFSNITVTNSPTGKTWYDSMQVKLTKRMSHGLQVNSTFTWSKAQTLVSSDIFNTPQKSIQSTDQPWLLNANVLYETQKWFSNKYLAYVTKNWQIGAFLQYGAGLPLTPPSATVANNLLPANTTMQMYRTGEPLFTKDLNCGCINPASDQVLNPKAWANPVAGTWGPGVTGTGAAAANTMYYTDFRQARRPMESINIARNFRFGERVNLQIRAEFSNAFNRTEIGNPNTSSSPLASVTRDKAGNVTGGFGAYTLATLANGATPSFTQNAVVGQLYARPREGTLVARFTF